MERPRLQALLQGGHLLSWMAAVLLLPSREGESKALRPGHATSRWAGIEARLTADQLSLAVRLFRERIS
jgi:hypothetical protein